MTQQVVDNPNTKYTFGAACVKACPRKYSETSSPHDIISPSIAYPVGCCECCIWKKSVFTFFTDNYVVTEGSCVRSCSSGMHEVEEKGIQRCKPCDGVCPKGTQDTHLYTHKAGAKSLTGSRSSCSVWWSRSRVADQHHRRQLDQHWLLQELYQDQRRHRAPRILLHRVRRSWSFQKSSKHMDLLAHLIVYNVLAHNQWSPTLDLEIYCPAGFSVHPSFNSSIKWKVHYRIFAKLQSLQSLDSAVGVGIHLKLAGQKISRIHKSVGPQELSGRVHKDILYMINF